MWMLRTRFVVGLAMLAVAGLGGALGVTLARTSPTRTLTVTVASTITRPARTVTHVRTIQRVRTEVTTVAVPTSGVGGVAARRHGPPSRSAREARQFSGTGPRVLGTITVSPPGAILRWTNSAGRFRLLFNGSGVAVDSTAHSGQIAAPPLTYRQVTVETPGRWTILIG
jgi:hypothetical protein